MGMGPQIPIRTWWFPIGIALLFGFVFFQDARGRADCEARCAQLGFPTSLYDAGNRQWARPETCECCQLQDGRPRSCLNVKGLEAASR